MADTPKGFDVFSAEVIAVQGDCEAGHRLGDVIKLSCWDSGGMCGFLYHDIFPTLQMMQFGGKMPWAPDGNVKLECPDKKNLVTIELRS